MSKLVVLNTHDGGMVNDPRDPRPNVYRNIQHFDNFTNPRKLTPYRSYVADAVTESTLDGYKIEKFCEGNGTIWGLGQVSSSSPVTQIYSKVTMSDLTSNWEAAPGTSTSASSSESYVMFVQYNNYLYGANTGGVWKYGDITSGGSETFTYNDYTTNVPTGQGIVHSADNILYFPSGNLVIYNDAGTYGVGFTLPSNSTIACICEFGNYLAIAYNMPNGKCAVGFWDRDVTNTALSEKIDWGMGSIQFIENVEGVLCGVSATAAINNSSPGAIVPRIYFKSYEYSYLSSYEGLNTVNIFAELVTDGTQPNFIPGSVQRYNELLYFLADIKLANGIEYVGIWKIFRNMQGAMAVSFDQPLANGAAIQSGGLYGMSRIGDYFFTAYVNSSSKNTVWRTNDQIVYAVTSEWDTTINQGMPPEDTVEKKKLLAVTALYESLPSGASVVVQYRVDGGSWTTIFTETTTGQIRTPPNTQAGSSGAFTDGYEYEFRVESTGGAEITALAYKYDTIKTQTNT